MHLINVLFFISVWPAQGVTSQSPSLGLGIGTLIQITPLQLAASGKFFNNL